MALKCSRYIMFLIILTSIHAFKKCKTLNGEEGACLEYYKCPSVYSKQNNSVFHHQEKDFLIDSYCGWWSMPKICCGKSRTYTNQYTKEIEKYNSSCLSKKEEHPRWLVKLKEKCYGAIITDRYIVGKASCMDNIRSVQLTHKIIYLEVIMVIKHPMANIKKEYYDIGLIKLRNTLPYKPICIQLEKTADPQPTLHIQDIGSKFWIVDPNCIKSRNCTATTVQLCPDSGYKTTICSTPCINPNNDFSILVSEDFSYIQGLTTACNQNVLTSINIWYFQWWIASNIK